MPKTRINRLDLTEVNRAVLAIEDEIDRVREQFAQLRSGKLPFTGDLDLGTFRITNAGTAESDDDTLTLGELQDRVFDIEDAELTLETSAAAGVAGGAKAARLARRTSQLADFAEEAASAIIANVTTPGVVFVDAAGDLDTDEVNFVWDDTNNRLGLLTASPSHTLHVGTGGLVRIADLTAGSVLFAGTSGVLSQDNTNLFWDDTNNRLGILDNTPSATLSVGATSQFQVGSDGDLDRINDVPYGWPVAQGAANTVLRNDGAGALTWVTTAALGIDHGTLVGLTDDDHPQYLLRAGRTGTTNDAIISTDADGSLTGSELAAFDLILRANNEAQAFANAGRVRINERVVLWEDIPDLTGTTTTQATSFDATVTITGGASGGPTLSVHRINPTLTLLGGGGTQSRFLGDRFDPAISVASGSSTNSFVTALSNTAAFTIVGTTHTISGRTLIDQPSYTTSATSTSASNFHTGNLSSPTLAAVGAGASLTMTVDGFSSAFGNITTDDVSASVTVPVWAGLTVIQPQISGPGSVTISTLIGVDIDPLTHGIANISLRSFAPGASMLHAGPIQLGDTSTDGFITGSTATAGDLFLSGTTADNDGLIRIQDELRFREDFPTPAGATTEYAARFTSALTLSNANGNARGIGWLPTGTISASASLQALAFEPTLTISSSNGQCSAVKTDGTITYETVNANFRLFDAQTTLLAEDDTFAPANGQIFFDRMTYQYSGAGTSGTLVSVRSFNSNFTIRSSDTSTLSVTNADPVHINPVIDEDAGTTLNLTNLRCVFIAPTVQGTPQITNVHGVNIASLPTGSTETISLRSTPSNAEMRHVGDAKFGVDAATSAKVHITEQTVGDEVLRVESVATNDDPNYILRQYRTTTTDATVTTLGAITLTASQTTLIEARVVARRTGGAAGTAEDGLGVVVRGGYKMVGGAATALTNGTPTTDFETDDQAAWTATLDTSGATVRVRVTGAASNNVTWHATVMIQTVGT